MWDSVLLTHNLSRAIVKAAMREGYAKTIAPETRSESRRVNAYVADCQRARCTHDALAFAAFANRLYLDDFSGRVYRGDSSPAESHLVKFISPDLEEFVKFTDSSDNLPKTLFYKPEHKAQLYSAIEPMIWKSFRATRPDVSRPVLSLALKLITARPDLVQLQFNSSKAGTLIRDALSQYWPKVPRDRATIDDLKWVCRLAITKGGVAANVLEECSRRNAVYIGYGLSFGRQRALFDNSEIRIASSGDVGVAVRIFVDEIGFWPVLRDFGDVLKLRRNKQFGEFRIVLAN